MDRGEAGKRTSRNIVSSQGQVHNSDHKSLTESLSTAPKQSAYVPNDFGTTARYPLITPTANAVSFLRRRVAAFTVIELLCVLGVILVLVGLMVAALPWAGQTSLSAVARSQINALEAAIELYKQENGGYPPLDQNAFAGVAGPEGFLVSDDKVSGAWNPFGNAAPGSGTPRLIPDDPKPSGWANSQYLVRALRMTSSSTGKPYYEFKDKQLKTYNGVTNGVSAGSSITILVDPYDNPIGYNPRNPRANGGTFDLWSSGNDGRSSYPSLNSDDIGNFTK